MTGSGWTGIAVWPGGHTTALQAWPLCSAVNRTERRDPSFRFTFVLLIFVSRIHPSSKAASWTLQTDQGFINRLRSVASCNLRSSLCRVLLHHSFAVLVRYRTFTIVLPFVGHSTLWLVLWSQKELLFFGNSFNVQQLFHHETISSFAPFHTISMCLSFDSIVYNECCHENLIHTPVLNMHFSMRHSCFE